MKLAYAGNTPRQGLPGFLNGFDAHERLRKFLMEDE